MILPSLLRQASQARHPFNSPLIVAPDRAPANGANPSASL
jgi:hypothetical protein